MKSFEEYKLENNFEKKVINVYDKINDISIIYRGCEYDEIDCSLDNMISFCQEMKKKYEGYGNVKIATKWQQATDSIYYVISFTRLETDEEFEERIKNKYKFEIVEKEEMEERRKREAEYKKALEKLHKKYFS